MSTNLGKLRRVNPRTIWPNEAHDFTPWLAENIQQLGEVLGMDLEVSEIESTVGSFSVDILAKDLGTGKDVVIENQYGATDHDHLGKLLTYASGKDAPTLVWIAETIREEHRQALDWLNERTDSETMLFAIVLEAIQIDQSAPAVNFKPVVFPNKWQKATRTSGKSSPTPRGEAYKKFFQKLIDDLREKHKFTKARVAQPASWASFSSGFAGVTFGVSFTLGGRVRVELYVDLGDVEENKKLFDWLVDKRLDIENQIGSSLEWERLDEKRASRIAFYRTGEITNTETQLEEIRQWAIDYLLKFKKIFSPLIKEYSKG
jgi:hypothetical protein